MTSASDQLKLSNYASHHTVLIWFIFCTIELRGQWSWETNMMRHRDRQSWQKHVNLICHFEMHHGRVEVQDSGSNTGVLISSGNNCNWVPYWSASRDQMDI